MLDQARRTQQACSSHPPSRNLGGEMVKWSCFLYLTPERQLSTVGPTAFSGEGAAAGWWHRQVGNPSKSSRRQAFFFFSPKTVKPISQFPFNNCRKNPNPLTFIPLVISPDARAGSYVTHICFSLQFFPNSLLDFSHFFAHKDGLPTCNTTQEPKNTCVVYQHIT